ncbi:T-complex protein 1 subunit zeta-2 isoform X5 [Arvicanthis niloticus]|uniref:T-complex protein 1 subunit zeta-2 isoform X5 n=1 Tax=Arvicanthis niloticus TaxID=61156 RepID=UPI00402B867F
MAAIKIANPGAEVTRSQAALAVNICAARGLQDVLRPSLGPKGALKMLVSGAGDIKLTKDGNVLLHEMQIQHPTASIIAKVAAAQDHITGDGTTSNVLIIGELLKQADLYISEGLHPRIIAEGFDVAKMKALEVLDETKVQKEMKREILLDVARTSLRTKVHTELADILTEAVVDSVLAIRRPGIPIDLFMVEIVEMRHKSETDTQLVRGLVLDHGARHPRMKKQVQDAYILICNVSLEYEKTLTLACGGLAVNSLEDLSEECLGHAGLVFEYALGEEKFTFIEDCVNPLSVTLLVKGPNKQTLIQIKDALRDGLRAVKNAIEDGCVVPGAGAVEVAIAEALVNYKHRVQGRARLGIQAFADALLIIPKVLAQNSGYDLQETLIKIQTKHAESKELVGIDLNTGEPMVAAEAGIWDNYCVKKHLLHSCTVIATNILLVDEIMRAGMSSLRD